MNLLKIQSELKAPKNQYNNFGKYKYRNCEDILEAVKPLLLKYNCTLTIHDEIVNIGTRFYIKAIAEFKDGKEVTTVTAFAREEEIKKGMDGSQVTGAASSYARKYALNGLFLIDDTKDADATNDHKEQPKQKETLTPERFAKAMDLVVNGRMDIPKVEAFELSKEQKELVYKHKLLIQNLSK